MNKYYLGIDYHTLALTENGDIYSWGKDAIALGHQGSIFHI